jgi:putative effector of murein hydrolase LrgA (UPF0299 family)
MLIIKRILVISLWAFIGLLIHNQFDPSTVIGSVVGSVFIFVWIAFLIIGIFIQQKLNKKK